MSRPARLLLVLALLLAAPCAPRASASVLLSSYSEANHNDTIQIADTHPSGTVTSAAGQSFQNVGVDAHLGSVKFYLSDLGEAPDGNLVAQLYAHTGTYGTSSLPTGAALATSDPVAATALTAGWVLYEFTFPTPYKMAADAYYTIFVYRTATAATVYFGTDNTAPAHGGNAFRYNAGAWAAISTEDAVFYVYAIALGSGDGTISFTLGNPVYENATDAGSVTVHASGDSLAEDFAINGDALYYAPVMPELFYWDLGEGYGRTMYIAGAEENFTVTLPEDTFATYGFTVKDYTGKLGTGAAYLEAYRTIAAETLIERGRIYAGNPVPLNLVVGRTYHLKVLWADGTRYDWGYYVTLSDTSTDLIIRGVQFGEQAYTVNRFITVQAARPAPTNITVDYADSRAGTVWLNVTIRVRNGPVAVTQSFATDTVAYTWAGAGASTDYAVTVNGRHQDQGEWGYGRILDAEQSFLPAPDLGTVFTLGGLDMSGILAYTLTLTTLLSFSYAFRERGLLAAMAVASIMAYLGWADWSYNLLALGWFFSVVVNLVGGRG